MVINGKVLANEIYRELANSLVHLDVKPRLTVITCDPNFETKKFLALKAARAAELGIEMDTIILPKEIDTEKIVSIIKTESSKKTGIIVQLPLPAHIDTNEVLKSIPKSQDIDAFGYTGEDTDILPPVVGAIAEIADTYRLEWKGKKVVVIGAGRLVGKPAGLYAQNRGGIVTILDENSKDIVYYTKEADIIILGAGQPNLLTADMVREGVFVFDAGASEDGGLLVGDAKPEVAEKAGLFTPVPGGIGPMTIAVLLRNLVKLHLRQ
ncbi:MAG: bifunctional 5,10-methylenetetrahydrofolate dehydrogenase/5,10-methenyltetrahydrofolate cyclohydrolase [Candidatus Nomurabacteria bacterium]|nr:bifunctional 5,10-methylenetetrahydrofolate dehydrogenase/5,10-methenyltetrahydrofolate cyclohydrolase [Candidatus Nomurabacteria bacterium]USN88166.1 MAG: bifunctional 5,10-methylenetetrahydrofolate dehydrogenase/5,10-methenyltetrahydrofolate cyclohydrolase [Candidatus Nomurabacteria bacterium]